MSPRILATLLLLCAIHGCAAPRKPAPAPERLRFELKTVDQRTGDCSDKSIGCATFEASYPVARGGTDPAVADSINRIVEDWLTDRRPADSLRVPPDSVAAGFVRSYEDFKREFPDSPQQWFIKRVVTVTLDTLDLVALAFHGTEYTGGAHGMERVLYANVDRRSGHRIRLAHLVEPGAEDQARVAGEREFRKVRQLKPEETLADAGFFDKPFSKSGTFELCENFSIGAEGLTFYYNPYEIAAYAVGPTRMTLSYEALTGLLRKDGPAGAFAR